MKIYTLTVCLFFTGLLAKSQVDDNSQWTWMKGDSTTNSPGVYGTLGISAATNKPAAGNSSVSWKDAANNLWLFDGVLWKYVLSTNQWTWIKGDSSANHYGTYGDLGIPATANQPGARSGSVSWTDLAGNLWLFGGFGNTQNKTGLLNDLWKYNPSTNQWTWVNGDSIPDIGGVYGTMGVPDFTSKPGNRSGSVAWTDVLGNLWLFGGRGYYYTNSPTLPINLNELWRYNPATNQWTWVRGSNLGADDPEPRYSGNSWIDGSGNLWLFGGSAYYPISIIFYNYNDLWKYDPITNQWTFMKGDHTPDSDGIYGTQGVANDDNTPGSRFDGVSWTDASGSLWLFGGNQSYMSFSGSGQGIFDDLWKYDPLSNQWMWLKGDNNKLDNHGVYGMQNVPAGANKPGSRWGDVSWTDNLGNLWLFGGTGDANSGDRGGLNDLWILGNPLVLPVTILSISAAVEQKNVLVKWQTSQEINTSRFIVERSADGGNFLSIGSVVAAGNSLSRRNYSFTDQQPVPGTNYYRVKMLDKDSSYKISPIVRITLDPALHIITVYPNPVISTATINVTTNAAAELKFSLFDEKGSLVVAKQIHIVAGKNLFLVDMRKLSKGTYTAVMTWGSENKTVQILKN